MSTLFAGSARPQWKYSAHGEIIRGEAMRVGMQCWRLAALPHPAEPGRVHLDVLAHLSPHDRVHPALVGHALQIVEFVIGQQSSVTESEPLKQCPHGGVFFGSVSTRRYPFGDCVTANSISLRASPIPRASSATISRCITMFPRAEPSMSDWPHRKTGRECRRYSDRPGRLLCWHPPSVAASSICLNMLGQWIDPRLPLIKSIALHPISFAGKQRHDLLGVGTDLAELARASIKRSR